MRSAAFEGGGYVMLEFEAGFDSTKALADVRAKVDDAKSDLPREVDEPKVQEINLSLFPVLVVALGGDLPERSLVRLARGVKTAIEQTPGVLSAELRGARDESVEIIVEPMLLKSYGVSLDDLIRSVGAGNSLVAAGAIEGGTGRFAVKVPALIERPEDVLKLPVVASSGASVTLGDVAEVRPTFKDAVSITRINGKPAISIEVVKRSGANIIETVDAVQATVDRLRPTLPPTLQITFQQDRSTNIRTMLNDLQNSVITGLLLVAMIMLYTLGWRASLFIGLAVPGSFLAGILALSMAGLTVNIVVLFTLILAIGELVDNAIIVTEYAERRMSEGMRPREAYALAAKRMAGPCFAATATRLVTFSPLLFWPGIVGEFMKYLPITFMATLIASLVFALVFTPTLGALIAKPNPAADDVGERVGERSLYMRVVKAAIASPSLTLLVTVATLVGVFAAYARFGNGVEFFPKVEPEYGLVHVRARGNLSLDEKDKLVAEVERTLFGMPEIDKVYARIGERQRGSDEVPEDTVGSVQYEFVDWQQRRPAGAIMDEIRQRTAHIPGVVIEVAAPRAGPPTGKPVTLRLAAVEPELLEPTAKRVADVLRSVPELRDIDDGLPLPGIDWRLEVDKAEAAKYGASALTVGNAVQLVTNGLKVTEYRPNETDKEVDILLRYPPERRSLDELDSLRINTPSGAVPIGNFVDRVPEQRVSIINRAQGARIMTVTANVAEGVQTAAVLQTVEQKLAAAKLPAGVTITFKGEDEESKKAEAFLTKAFATAIFLIFATLLAQFNRFSSVLHDHERRRLLDGRRIHRAARDRAAARHRHDRSRHHLDRRHHREQQHRADRHLRPAQARGHAGPRRHPGDLQPAGAAGVPHGHHQRARRHADRLRGQHRFHRARGDGRRSLDAMVGAALDRDRVRARLRHRADPRRHAGDAHGGGQCSPPRASVSPPGGAVPPAPGPKRPWEPCRTPRRPSSGAARGARTKAPAPRCRGANAMRGAGRWSIRD